MNTTQAPICMAEDFWANSQLSIARYYGRAKFGGHEYYIVDKLGRDLWECSFAADRAGSDKAIPAGEPADLVRRDFIPFYRKLGRDKFLEVLKAHQQTPDKELMAIYKDMTAKPKKVKQPNLFDNDNQGQS